MLLKIIGAFIAWFSFGTVINIFSGWLSSRRLRKYFPEENWKQDMERDLRIRNMQEGYEEPSTLDLALDALFWPITQVYAWIGQKKIKNSLEEEMIRQLGEEKTSTANNEKNLVFDVSEVIQNGRKNGENGGESNEDRTEDEV